MGWLWVPIAVLGLIDVVWAKALGIKLMYQPILLGLGLTIWFVYSRLRPDRRIATIAMSVAILNASLAAVAVFTYLAVLSGRPPIDGTLAAVDEALGFDWLKTYTYVMDRPALQQALAFCYWSLNTQIAVLLVFLNITNRLERTEEFIVLFAITLIACGLGAFIWPADSAWAHYGITGPIAYHMPHMDAMRAGTMTSLNLHEMHGIITFPSFHATLGALLTYACRGTILFWPAAILNLGMIAATPTIGGHHFIDVPAGLAIALGFIAVRRYKTSPKQEGAPCSGGTS